MPSVILSLPKMVYVVLLCWIFPERLLPCSRSLTKVPLVMNLTKGMNEEQIRSHVAAIICNGHFLAVIWQDV